jgi:peptidoglycan/LPS O-acetylase OafA/YrhL
LGLLLVVVGASVLYFAIERPAKAWLRAAAAGRAGVRPLRAAPEPAAQPE